MNGATPRRLLGLTVLTVLGLGLAVAAASLGATEPIAAGDAGGEFTVSEDDVRFSTGDRETVVVEDLNATRTIQIEEVEDGRFTVRTESEPPGLTERERERARAVALGNDTVRERLDAMETYELRVEPVQKLNLSATRIRGNVTEVNESEGVFAFEAENLTVEDENESVVVSRDPSYVDDEATVRVTGPDANESRYSVHVDLANETVEGITDWEDVRENSTTVDGSQFDSTG